MPAPVFYSLSPFGTGTIETGAGNITITSGVAVLTVAQTGNIAVAVDKTATLQWEQECIDGCPEQNIGAVDGWRIYMSDTSGVYGTTPIIDMPYSGTPAPNYTSEYVLTLTGSGTKYFVVTAYNAITESGYSNEVNYPYNFSGAATPVNLIFTISEP